MTETSAAYAADHDLLDQVRAAWAEVLELDTVPLDVNFFEAGGDSLLLIVLLERVNELTEREFEAADLFQHSTVRAQAELLARYTTGSTTGSATGPAMGPATGSDARPELALLGARDRAQLLGRARRG